MQCQQETDVQTQAGKAYPGFIRDRECTKDTPVISGVPDSPNKTENSKKKKGERTMFTPLYSYLKTYMIQNSWEDEYTRNGSRSIFTTICLCCNIDADTAICDQMLAELYQTADIQSADVSREEFENFMLEDIV